jgi:hypothetical protein
MDAKGYNKTLIAMDAIYRSALNRDVGPARPGEFMPLNIGSLRVWPPVVLAPMAGVTNYPFRAVRRRFGAGLYVSEMITARPLVEGNEKTLKLADFGPDETPRNAIDLIRQLERLLFEPDTSPRFFGESPCIRGRRCAFAHPAIHGSKGSNDRLA